MYTTAETGADRMPRIIKINHIGLAVESLEQALGVYAGGLGLAEAGREYVPGDAVRVAFLPVGDSRLELLEPVGEEGPLQKFLANRGQGMHHMCLEVEDLRGMLARLRDNGVELIDNEPRPGAHGTQVAFIHPKSANGVLIELVERTED
jgi:methylmalonyl-CoA epimerase